MDSATLLDFLGLLVRWLHVIAGIAWIGSSFYFIWLDNSLYAPGTQPEEGSRGYDDDQLIKLGKDIGITSPAFAVGIKANKYDSLVNDELEKAEKAPYLQQDYGNGQVGFGTPTVANGQKVVDISNPQWLNQLG